jgi:uncharacterized Zn finger protein
MNRETHTCRRCGYHGFIHLLYREYGFAYYSCLNCGNVYRKREKP